MKTRLLAFWIASGGSLASLAPAATVDDFVARTYTDSTGTLPYRLFIPTNYNAATKYPLVLFLHGGGENGTDNRLQLTGQTGPLVFASATNQTTNPSFMVAPQCPVGGYWTYDIQAEQVQGMMDALMAEFPIDADRVYITGLSNGGFGTWDYVTRHPQMYAAAVPMNGGGNTALAGQITNLPIWNFHAANDGVIAVSYSRQMVGAVRRAGGNVIYTEYTSGGHGIWTPAYNTPILMDWVYSQKRGTFSSAPFQLGILSPTEQPLYRLNGTNLNLSGSVTIGTNLVIVIIPTLNGTNRITKITWTNYSTGVSAGLAQGTTNWSATNIVVDPSVTNLVLVTAFGTSWWRPYGGATTFNDTLAVTVPTLNPIITSGTNGFTLSWFGGPGARYQVQWTPGLFPPAWTSFTNIITSATTQFSFLDDGTQTGGLGDLRFYQPYQIP